MSERIVKPSYSVPQVSVRLFRASFRITSIEPRHETSAEPSRSPGDDGITSGCASFQSPVRHLSSRSGCAKPPYSVPQVSVRLYRAGFRITTIEPRHETSAEPSRSPGDDGITPGCASFQSPARRLSSRSGCAKPPYSVPQVSVRLFRAGFGITSIEPRHETSAEPS
jgi:hypothetical protein